MKARDISSRVISAIPQLPPAFCLATRLVAVVGIRGQVQGRFCGNGDVGGYVRSMRATSAGIQTPGIRMRGDPAKLQP